MRVPESGHTIDRRDEGDGGHGTDTWHRHQSARALIVVRATGDLDCDGKSALYELRLTVQGSNVERAWTRKDPYE